MAARIIANGERLRHEADRAIRRGREARDRAAQVAWMVREIILRFRLHRVPAISGVSDHPHHIRRPQESLSIWIGPSGGAVCDGCGKAIAVGESQYDLNTRGHETHLHHECFRLCMNEV